MSSTANEILESALKLPEASEVEIRTKISRLYYALYSHACEFNNCLPSQGNVLKKDAGSHLKLTQMLTNPTVTDESLQYNSRQMGTKQKLAHEIRVKADYYLDENVNKADLMKCARYARESLIIPLPARAAA